MRRGSKSAILHRSLYVLHLIHKQNTYIHVCVLNEQYTGSTIDTLLSAYVHMYMDTQNGMDAINVIAIVSPSSST